MNLRLPLLVLALCLGAISWGDEPVKAKAWEGEWAAVSVQNNGEKMPDERAQKLRLTLTADRYKTELGDQVLFDSTYTIDTTKSPAHIDIIGTEGDFKGKAALGLIKVDGDTLTMCYVMPGGERPSAMESPPGSRVTLLITKRAEKK